MDSKLDLAVEKIIRAPKSAVWKAWTTPELFAQWWIPEPYSCQVEHFDADSGGGFITRMSEDSKTYVPHMNAAFLLVKHEEKIVFTNAVDSTLRPAFPQSVAVTGEVTLNDHPDGTIYRIVARHADEDGLKLHEELGLYEGWSLVTNQLARLSESLA